MQVWPSHGWKLALNLVKLKAEVTFGCVQWCSGVTMTNNSLHVIIKCTFIPFIADTFIQSKHYTSISDIDIVGRQSLAFHRIYH